MSKDNIRNMRKSAKFVAAQMHVSESREIELIIGCKIVCYFVFRCVYLSILSNIIAMTYDDSFNFPLAHLLTFKLSASHISDYT